MNEVYSVKNLNGDFSGIMDYSLTELVSSNSGIWNDVKAYQNNSGTYALTADTDYLSGAIDYVSANAGGLSGDYVSGVNKINDAYGHFTACQISGDIKLTSGFDNTPYSTYSLFDIANNTFDKSRIEKSITLIENDKGINVYNLGYQPILDSVISAHAVSIYSDNRFVTITFNSTTAGYPFKNIASAIVTIEGSDLNAVQFSVDSINMISSGNGSGMFVYYPPMKECEKSTIKFSGQNITNVDASAYLYYKMKVNPLAFINDLPDVSNKLDTSAFSSVSGSFLTGVDLTPYATTAEVDSISSILSGAIDYVSANIGDEFPISADEAIQYVENNSGTINDVNTSYQTNSGTFITAYPAISAEEWNDCYDNVNTNSGVWGGSSLPISAGPGIKVNLVDNTLVFSNDETLLWSGSLTCGQTAALSDSVKNYDRIRFYIEETNRHRKATNELVLTDLSNTNLREFALNMQDATTSYFGNYFTVYDINEVGDSLTSVSGRQWWYSPWTAAGINGSPDRGLILTRVIGINRK